MEDNWKYLGDILSSDGKNDANIKARTYRGLGAITNIFQTLKDLCLGRYFFEAAMILRDSLLLSTLLSNSEAWVNLTPNNVKDLETIDEHFLRNLFYEPHSRTSLLAKTPLEMLYLETGCIPIRFILQSRRLNFLHYILNDKEDSLLSNFFRAQCDKPVKGDWVTTVQNDMKDLELEMTFEQIKSVTKDEFKQKVKQIVKKKAFEFLQNLQQTHSKAKPLKYAKLSLQDYLKHDSEMTLREKTFSFAARLRMLDLKCNFKIGKKDLMCSICGKHAENQEGLLTCEVLLDSTEKVKPNSYSDLFSLDKTKVTMIAKILRNKFLNYQVHRKNGNNLPSAAPSVINNLNNVSNDSGDMD